jgi:hypothetical protein
LGARQEPLAGAAGHAVNPAPHEVENFRNVLDLVQYGRQAQTIQEALRIVPETGDHIRILKQFVRGLGKEMTEKPRLPRPPGSGEDDRWKAPRSAQDLCFKLSLDVSHI